MKKLLSGILFFLMIQFQVYSQQAVGDWNEYLPYYSGVHIAEAGNKIYCSTENGLFFYNKQNNSVEKLTKLDGLSDVGISLVEHNDEESLLFIAYTNSNIDLLLDDNTIVNIPDIKDKIMPGDKAIYSIYFIHQTAYLACGFGIVVVDLERHEIKDTWFIGPGGSQISVYDIEFDGATIFAATEKGIYYADITNPFLADFSNWSGINSAPFPEGRYTSLCRLNGKLFALYDHDESVPADSIYYFDYNQWQSFPNSFSSEYLHLRCFNDQLIVMSKIAVGAYDSDFNQKNFMHSYPFGTASFNYAIQDIDSIYWYADQNYGLVKSRYSWAATAYYPNGPYQSTVFDMDILGGHLYAAGGGRDPSWSNTYSLSGIYTFSDGLWENLNRLSQDDFPENVYDITEVVVDPKNPEHFFAGSWGFGVLEFLGTSYQGKFNQDNSSLQSIFSGAYCRIGGMAYDSYHNLWVSNAGVDHVLSVYSDDGEWYGFPYGSQSNAEQAGDIVITQNNDKWLVLPKGGGLFVFNEQGTFDDFSDDEYTKLSVKDEDGEVINDIYSIAIDKDQLIWLGTNQGVLVYYNPYSVFQSSLTAQRIIVELDGVPQHLLGTETVTAIAIDGANRKWFGTRSAGVFLMSDDATEQVYQFNTSNSPLLSNYITALAIDPESGEVFFGTDKGISSFRSTATEGNNDFSGLYVFPNPVRPGYDGDIVIKGTTADAYVKITDISGNLVYESRSFGGQAIWNGEDHSGKKVSTGVYLVFCTNEDGSETEVTKLLFVK